MDPIQQLIELEAIKRVKASYIYYVDTKNWSGWLSLFTPDISFRWDDVVSPAAGAPPANLHLGLDRVKEITTLLESGQTMHRVTAPLIDLVSDTEARGIWHMEDIVEFPGRTIHGHGHYHETYRKLGGVWKIKTLHLTRQRLAVTSR